MFSKFKNILKIFKGKLSRFLLIVFIGILFEIAIFLPCPVYGNPFFVGQGIFESSKGGQMCSGMVGSQIFTDIGSVTSTGVDVGFQNIELDDEGASEFIGGFIKCGDGVNTDGVFISDPPSNKCTNNGKTTSNECYFVGSRLQFWGALLSGGFLGLVIAALVLQGIFYLKSHT